MQSSRDHLHFDNKIREHTHHYPTFKGPVEDTFDKHLIFHLLARFLSAHHLWRHQSMELQCGQKAPGGINMNQHESWSALCFWGPPNIKAIILFRTKLTPPGTDDVYVPLHFSKRSSTPPCSKHLLDSLILLVLRFRLPSEALGLGLGSDRTVRWDRIGVGSQPPFAVSPGLSP